MKVDKVELHKIRHRLENDIEDLLKTLKEFSPDINFDSAKQLMEFLFLEELEIEKVEKTWVAYKTEASIKKHDGALGRYVNKKHKIKVKGLNLDPDADFKTKAGFPSVSKDAIAFYIVKAMERSDEKIVNFLKTLKVYKQLSKLHGTYAVGIEQALENTQDGTIYSRYKLDGTVTGRLSCAAATRGPKKEDKLGISFHTLPREEDERYNIRSVFVCDEDEDFICADFSTMELRILAHISKDRFLCKAFNEGRDLHTFTASLIYNKPEEKITKQERSVAKTVNFGIVYGAGLKKIAATCEMTVAETKRIFNKHKEIFKEAHGFLKSLEGYIKLNKYVISLFGRYRRLPDVESSDSAIVHSCLRKGKNFVIQSSASDVLVAANIEIYNFLRESKFPAKVIANVHDSIEIICKKTHTSRLLPLIKKILVKPRILKEEFNLELSVPLEVDFEIGPSFGKGEKVSV